MNSCYTYISSPIGEITLASDGSALTLCALGRLSCAYEQCMDNVLRQAAGELSEYFSGERREFGVPLRFEGTEFQRAVWRAMTTIPYGSVLTYSDIAWEVGKPNAARAVGSACGRNRIMIFAPCHRVVARDGLGGFSSGLDIKIKLLELEKCVFTGAKIQV